MEVRSHIHATGQTMVTTYPDSVFDRAEGNRRKKAGMELAAGANANILEVARRAARRLAEKDPTRLTNSDEVLRYLMKIGYDEHCLGNAAGSVFRGKEWEATGYYRASERVSRRSNKIQWWKLKLAQ